MTFVCALTLTTPSAFRERVPSIPSLGRLPRSISGPSRRPLPGERARPMSPVYKKRASALMVYTMLPRLLSNKGTMPLSWSSSPRVVIHAWGDKNSPRRCRHPCCQRTCHRISTTRRCHWALRPTLCNTSGYCVLGPSSAHSQIAGLLLLW